MSHGSHMTHPNRTHHTLEGSVHAKGFDSQRDVKESITPEALVATLQGTSRWCAACIGSVLRGGATLSAVMWETKTGLGTTFTVTNAEH